MPRHCLLALALQLFARRAAGFALRQEPCVGDEMRRFRWLIAVLLGAVLVGLINLSQPAPPRPGAQIAYSDLMAEAEGGNVRDAVITGRALHGRLRDGRAIRAYLPVEPDRLVERLVASGAYVVGSPAEDDVNPLLHYVLAWVPYILFLLAFRSIGIRLVTRHDEAWGARIRDLEARLATAESKAAPP